MTSHVIIHHKTIQNYLHKTVQIFFECFGNNFLICSRSIFNSKQHYLPYKNSLVYNKCNLYMSYWTIKIWWYPKYPSKKGYGSYHVIVFNTSYVKGNGYESFFVAAFSFLKSILILSLPFFLGTTTIGDNHVVSSTNWMNPIANNLSIACLTTITQFGIMC